MADPISVVMHTSVAIGYGVIFLLLQVKHKNSGQKHLVYAKIGYFSALVSMVFLILNMFLGGMPGLSWSSPEGETIQTLAFISLLLQLPAFISVVLLTDRLAGGKIGSVPIIILLLIFGAGISIYLFLSLVAGLIYLGWVAIVFILTLKCLMVLSKASPDDLKKDVNLLILATYGFFISVLFWNLVPIVVDLSAIVLIIPVFSNGAYLIFWCVLFGFTLHRKPELGNIMNT